MSNAVMDTHSMSFVTIGNLVSPSSSVNGDPLDDFSDHWQPSFFFEFPSSPDKWRGGPARPLRTKRLACFRVLRQRRSWGRSRWPPSRFPLRECLQPFLLGSLLLLDRFRGCKLPRSLLCPTS